MSKVCETSPYDLPKITNKQLEIDLVLTLCLNVILGYCTTLLGCLTTEGKSILKD